jgi:hypothetical protein
MRDHRNKINTFTHTQTRHQDPTQMMYNCRYDKDKFSTYLYTNYEVIDHAHIRERMVVITRYHGSLHKLVLNDGSCEGWSCELLLYHSVTRRLHPRDYPVQPTAIVLITPLGHPIILYQCMGRSHQSPKPIRCTRLVSHQQSEWANQKQERAIVWTIYLTNIHGYLIIQISISTFQA